MKPDNFIQELKHIDYPIQLNGTLNRAYEKEYDKYVEDLGNAATANNLKQVETTINDIIDIAVASAERFSDNFIKSSSPSQSYDAIIPESELVDHPLTEKRSGNGARYFVDEPPNVESDDEENEDCDIAIAILDGILENEESSQRCSDMSLQSPVSVRDHVATAIVHHVEDENWRTSALPQNVDKPVFAVIEDTNQKEFINKLNTLFKQKTLPSRNSKVQFDEGQVSTKQKTSARPTLVHSKSEVANLYLLAAATNNKTDSNDQILQVHSDVRTDQNLETVKPPEASSRKENADSSRVDKNNNDKIASIPVPPPFDPELFNAIARKKSECTILINNSIQPSDERIVIEIENKPNAIHPKKISNLVPLMSPVPRNGEVSSAEEDQIEPVDIRQKLEKIFSQTLPERLSKRQRIEEPIMSSEADINEEDSIKEPTTEEKTSRASSFKERIKKFDTVEKQKALFSNVLKQLEPAGSNLKRNPSSNRISASQVFDFYNKIDNSSEMESNS